MITLAELDHLCVLGALHLSDEKKKELLPQLDHIIEFVGQLNQCPTEDVDLLIDAPLFTPHENVPNPPSDEFTVAFLANIHHRIVQQMPHLATKTST